MMCTSSSVSLTFDIVQEEERLSRGDESSCEGRRVSGHRMIHGEMLVDEGNDREEGQVSSLRGQGRPHRASSRDSKARGVIILADLGR